MAIASSPDVATPQRVWVRGARYVAALIGVTILLLVLRERIDKAHVALAFLLVVLVAAADGGLRVGLAIASLAFLAFNWFFLPPYGTFVIDDPLDWFVLMAFLLTSLVASNLFHRVQREADAARERTREVSSLATTGAEAMRAPRAQSALHALAEGVRRTLGVSSCAIFVAAEPPAEESLDLVTDLGGAGPASLDEARTVMQRRSGLLVLPDGIHRFTASPPASDGNRVESAPMSRLVLPVWTGDTAIGAVAIGNDIPFTFSSAQWRLLDALLYYVTVGSERLRLERATEHVEALEAADRLKNAVLASVSHDLRTPLTTITALAHDMAALGDERADIIAQEAARLNRFVRDLLDVSRLTSGGMPVRPEVVPADELVSAALQQVEGAFDGREIRVSLDPSDPLLLGTFDPVQTVRAVVNLLENAQKYAPMDTPIDLSVRREGPHLTITVADRGPGVPPHEVTRIFEPLYRPEGALPDAGSAGLGLAIARGFAEAQGGSLTYATRDGGGSVFTLQVPAADAP